VTTPYRTLRFDVRRLEPWRAKLVKLTLWTSVLGSLAAVATAASYIAGAPALILAFGCLVCVSVGVVLGMATEKIRVLDAVMSGDALEVVD